ncbi:hypothetical protein VTJ04DRAFT_1089 [Mycothermus thermophilus]|uniref:uncharacterized protein n=1 Tax=Humicola insolens TaxID=85995 RepID=UPI003743F2F5
MRIPDEYALNPTRPSLLLSIITAGFRVSPTGPVMTLSAHPPPAQTETQNWSTMLGETLRARDHSVMAKHQVASPTMETTNRSQILS